MARVWMPLPDRDFEPSEAAFPWRALTRAGHEVVFATEHGGSPPEADPRLLRGVLFGKMGTSSEGRAAYDEMASTEAYRSPVSWTTIDPGSFDGLVLPGGHAPGMRQYLDAQALQSKVGAFWKLGRPVGAICHGVLVLARTRDAQTGKSVIAAKRTTCLPKYMEAAAYAATFWKLGRYYRTYDLYVEDEVRAALDRPSEQFEKGPFVLVDPSTGKGERRAFVVEDGFYVSARWPGDAHLFAETFAKRVDAWARPNGAQRSGAPLNASP
jgi:putative intracellular protease/amidase